MAARHERVSCRDIDRRDREDLLERDRLAMIGPPAERIVHMDDDAARCARMQPPHHGGHERAVDPGEHDGDALPRQRRVPECGIEQLAVEQVADDDVVTAAPDRGRGRLTDIGDLTAGGDPHSSSATPPVTS